MRRLATGLLALGLGLSGAGCIIIAKGTQPVHICEDGKRFVVIEGELYKVDLEQNRIEKADGHSTTTTTTVETKPN